MISIGKIHKQHRTTGGSLGKIKNCTNISCKEAYFTLKMFYNVAFVFETMEALIQKV